MSGLWAIKFAVLNSLLAAAALTFAAVTGYWAQDRDAPVRFVNIAIDPKPVSPGKIMLVHYDIVRKKTCQVKLEQVLFDSQRVRYVLSELSYVADPGFGGSDRFAIPIQLPYVINPGMAHYRAVRIYYCNPLQRWLQWPIIVEVPDVPFEGASNG